MKLTAIVVWILLLVWLVVGSVGGVILLRRPPGEQRALVAAEATVAFLPALAIVGGALAVGVVHLLSGGKKNPYAAQAFAILVLTPRLTPDAQALWQAAVRMGWEIERLERWDVPERLRNSPFSCS